MKILPHSRLGWIRLSLLAAVPVGIFLWFYFRVLYMPGSSFTGPLPPLDEETREVLTRLETHVTKLATEIGPRNLAHPGSLEASLQYMGRVFEEIGYATATQEYDVGNNVVANLDAEKGGGSRKDEIVLVGAHYDTQTNAPGANDNGTGVAGALEIARLLAPRNFERTIRFVAFVNEEPPYFHKPVMGSVVYSHRCRERNENIVAAIVLETIGYYSDERGSQQYPTPYNLLYPSRGNFIGFIGNSTSGPLVRRCIGLFRKNARFPSEGIVAPDNIPDAGWSDHWSFWQEGYPAIMVTDTALYRYTYYHTQEDTPDKVDFEKTARVVVGLAETVAGLAGEEKLKPQAVRRWRLGASLLQQLPTEDESSPSSREIAGLPRVPLKGYRFPHGRRDGPDAHRAYPRLGEATRAAGCLLVARDHRPSGRNPHGSDDRPRASPTWR